MRRYLALVLVSLFCAVTYAEPFPFVDWGGDYVSSFQGMVPVYVDVAGDFDSDGFSDDHRATRAYDQVTAMCNYDYVPQGKSGAFYGGYQGTVFDCTEANQISALVYGSGPEDYIEFHQRMITADYSGLSFHSIVEFPKAEFLNGEDLTSATPLGSISVCSSRLIEATARFAVRQDGILYLSEYTFTGSNQTYTLDNPGSATTWAPYDPTADMNFDQAGAMFAPMTFDHVQAVGYYTENDWLESGGIVSRVLGVTATTPEPTSFMLFALAGLFIRRR